MNAWLQVTAVIVPRTPQGPGASVRRKEQLTTSEQRHMRDLIGIGLALFLGIVGTFYAFGLFGGSNSNSQIQETFVELQQARRELASFATQNGGYSAAVFTTAQIQALQFLPSTAINGANTLNQWRGTIAITGNTANFFVDYSNIDASSCARLVTKTPINSGVSGIAVAATTAGLTAATVNALPISAASAATLCTATMAVRFVVSG
jgi:hypothetical protein